MRKLLVRLFGLTSIVAFVPALALAADDESPIILVADTRKFYGWQAWWANLYNSSHFNFALATVIIIPVVGIILGVLADAAMSRLGIDLKNRTLAEH
jgi:MFS superfamily sulfate permease-like transporter